MSEPAVANDHEQHTTTIEISGNGQINAAFENTEGPEGAPTPQTPPPPSQIQRPTTPPPQAPRPTTPPPQVPTAQQNGDTPHINGEAKTNGVEPRTPGSEDTKEVTEAVNLELVNMQPYSNSIPIKKESTELDIGDPYDEYFVPVNQHKKYMRGEKLYVTQDKRRSLGASKKKCCWGVLTVIVLGGIVAILLGVIISSQDNTPVEESRNLNGMWATNSVKEGSIIRTPSPSTTPTPPRPTTDMSEMYLKNVLQGELTIDNLQFTQGLANRSSSEFSSLAASLEEELKSALFDHQTLHYGSANITVKVLEFRPGSIVVAYRVGWEFKDGVQNPPDPIDKDGLKARLQDHLRSRDGFLYNYRVTLHNLKSERVSDICKIDNGGCSHNCIFNKTSLQNECTCEEMQMLSSDGKTCMSSDRSESDSSSSENDSKNSSSEQESESSMEVHKPSEEQSKEPSSTSDRTMPTEPETSQEHESTAEPGHKHSLNIQPTDETEPPVVPEYSPNPLPENNTSEMYENVDYGFKTTSESTLPQEPMTESNGLSGESDFSGHHQYSGEQSTEVISQTRASDMSMDIVSSSEPTVEYGSQPQTMNVSELPLTSRTSSTPMYPANHFNTETGFSMTLETTPEPSSHMHSEENYDPHHWSDESSEIPETFENPNEFSSAETSSAETSSAETSSAVPSTSDRLPKYNQFPPATADMETYPYSHTTDSELQSEIATTNLKEVEEQKTTQVLPEYKTEQPSEYSQNFYSSSQPSVSPTVVPEEISTGEIHLDNSEIKSMNNENTEIVMTSPSSTTQSYSDSEPKNENSDVVQTTNKSFDMQEDVGSSMNLSNETGSNNSSKESEGITGLMHMTTMMPLIQNEEINNSDTLPSIFHNTSEPSEIYSLESHTDPTNTEHTVMNSQNNIHFESDYTMPNTEINTLPTEHTHVNISQSSEHDFVENSDVVPTTNKSFDMREDVGSSMNLSNETDSNNTSSSVEPVDAIINTAGDSIPAAEPIVEASVPTTEMPGDTNTFINLTMIDNSTKHTNMESETNEETTEPITTRSTVQYEGPIMYEEPKLPTMDNSDEMGPTFLVGGENMPTIALTPNPDLSGPYSVDSTISPVTEEDDTEEIKSTKPVNLDGLANPEVDNSNKWYDSKNAVNSLDDDYNDEDKYGSYKLVKGKPEHITKGYKNIKIEDTGHVPDSDADEQMHDHQVQQVPFTTSDRSPKLISTEVNESSTSPPSTEKSSTGIREEERLLIKEVYPESMSETSRPSMDSESSTERLFDSHDINTMNPQDLSQTPSNSSSESTNVKSDTTMPPIEDKSELKEMEDMSNIEEKNNTSSTSDSMSSEEIIPTTLSSLMSSSGSTFEENIPISTMHYKDNNSSASQENKCDTNQFACHDGSMCLEKAQQCDGINDCADGSDERECEMIDCGENFKCKSGDCISKHLVCNRLQNCPDGSDEENCDSEEKHEMKQNEQIFEQSNFTETATVPTESKTEVNLTKSPAGTTEPIMINTEAPASLKELIMNSTSDESKSNLELVTISPEASVSPVVSSSDAPKITMEEMSDSAESSAGLMGQTSSSSETSVSPTEPIMSNTEVPANSMELNINSTEEPLSPPQPITTSSEAPVSPVISSSESPSSMEKMSDSTEAPTNPIEQTVIIPELPEGTSAEPTKSTEAPLNPIEQIVTTVAPIENIPSSAHESVNSGSTEVSSNSTTDDVITTQIPPMGTERSLELKDTPIESATSPDAVTENLTITTDLMASSNEPASSTSASESASNLLPTVNNTNMSQSDS